MQTSHRAHVPNNVATAVVIKDEDLFLLSDSTGDVPLNNDQGFGLTIMIAAFFEATS